MTQSLSVVRLDVLSIRQYLGIKQLGLYALVALFIGFGLKDFYFSCGILSMYALFYSSYPFIMAEKNQLDLLYASLPLHKHNLVLGRYLFALCMNVCAAVFAFFLNGLYSLIRNIPMLSQEYLLALLVLFFVVSFFEFLQMPFYFKLGYTKAKMIAMLPLLLLPLGTLLAKQLLSEGMLDMLLGLLDKPVLLVGIAVCIWVIVGGISLCLSQRFYAKREF